MKPALPRAAKHPMKRVYEEFDKLMQSRCRASLRVSRTDEELEAINDQCENEIIHVQVRDPNLRRGNGTKLSRDAAWY